MGRESGDVGGFQECVSSLINEEVPKAKPRLYEEECVSSSYACDVVLRRCVKKLHFGGWEEKEAAAAEIKRLAAEEPRRRRLMAELGVIPPLVAMVADDSPVDRRRLAVQASIELAHASYT